MDDFKTKPIHSPIIDSETRAKIFSSASDSSPQMLKRSFYQSNKWYIWSIFVALIIIGVLGYLAFRKQPIAPTREANVQLAMDVPETVSSNGDFVYRVKVENQDSSKLVNLELEMVYPEGMSYVSSSPAAKNNSGSLFVVPDLVSGQNAVLTIKAHMDGSLNDVKELKARLRYRYENFNSTFEKSVKVSVRLSASDIALEMEGPFEPTTAQLVTYSITYKNNSDKPLKNARILVSYPDGFIFQQSEPAADLGKNIWNVYSLDPGQAGNFSVTGTFAGSNAGESKIFSAEFAVLDASGSFFTQATASFTSQIVSLPLYVAQEIQTRRQADSVAPGDTLGFAIHYKNFSSTVARGVNIVVTLDSKAWDLNSIEAEGAQVNGNTITWNAASSNILEALASNAEGDLRYTVKVKSPAARDLSKNILLSSSVKIKSDEYETYFPGNKLDLKVASPASLVRTIQYISGSLPPKVGNDTNYKIIFSLRNSTNDFSNGQLIAYIPLDPSSFEPESVTRREASSVTFDKSTGKLVWNFATLPGHTGDFNPPRSLEFTLRLNPTSAQAGSFVTLVKNISASAQDTFTNETIQLTVENLTTQSLQTSDGSSVGYVQK